MQNRPSVSTGDRGKSWFPQVVRNPKPRLASTGTTRVQLISESHITIADAEDDIENLTTVLLKLTDGLRGLVSHLTLLGGLECIGIVDRTHLTILHGQVLEQFTDVRIQSKR